MAGEEQMLKGYVGNKTESNVENLTILGLFTRKVKGLISKGIEEQTNTTPKAYVNYYPITVSTYKKSTKGRENGPERREIKERLNVSNINSLISSVKTVSETTKITTINDKLIDINISGMKISTIVPGRIIGEKIKLYFKIGEHFFNIAGVIRNISEKEGLYEYGIMFENIDHEQKVNIRNIIRAYENSKINAE